MRYRWLSSRSAHAEFRGIIACHVALALTDAALILPRGWIAHAASSSALLADRATLERLAIIHALEPGSHNFELLAHNTERFPNVRAHRIGLFSRSGKATLHLDDSGIENSLVIRDDRSEEVDLITLDEFMAAHRIEHVDILKLDVEGAEEEIITASRRLGNVDVIVGELHLRVIDKARLLASLDPFFVSHCAVIGPESRSSSPETGD